MLSPEIDSKTLPTTDSKPYPETDSEPFRKTGFLNPHLTGSIVPQLIGPIDPDLTIAMYATLVCAKHSSKSQLVLPNNFHAHYQNSYFSVPSNPFTFVY